MNSDFLRSLIALSQEGSIARAAQSQGLTATAISQRIKALEEQIGSCLTIRSGKTIQLTEAGQRILPHAKQLLRAEQDLVNSLNHNRISGQLELGVISTAMTGIIPGALNLIRNDKHDLEVQLHPGTSKQLYNRLLSDDLDAIVISAPPFSLSKELKVEVITQEPLCLIAAKGSLSEYLFIDDHMERPMLSSELIEELRQKPFIQYDHNSWGGKLVTQFLRDHKISTQKFCELDALEAITVLVNSDLGLALIPDWQGPWPGGLDLNKITITDTRYYRKTILLRKMSTVKETAISYFGKTLNDLQTR
ncbi:LysR family transcriptional regulator [Kiloniella spongiae]|uniref:LysR family transcriptional regulator n=1 Tax=Kiloniella spongiae TaxID=1489064 RepID=UPI00069B730E|nr:LysR substrate-binding domain-containing protein [Kiloniella spongiae]